MPTIKPMLKIIQRQRDNRVTGGLMRLEHRVRWIGRALGLAIVATLIAQPIGVFAAGTRGAEMSFAPTGTVQGEFLRTFQKYGLSLIGYPISDELTEGGATVQYFEKVKMEYHPELAAKGTTVQFTLLGSEISSGAQFGKVTKFISSKQKSYFGQTRHSLAEPFLSFWRDRGRVELFGYPISEVVQQDGMSVQWFERARMEYHPELVAKGQAVQLTLLGRIAHSRKHSYSWDVRNVQQVASISQGEIVSGSMENSLLTSINAQRSAAGLPVVAFSEGITAFARSRSSDMASRRYFAHVTPEGKAAMDMLKESGVKYSIAGEILAKNNSPDEQAAEIALKSYLQSPPHRAIMLDGRYTQAGVGYAKSSDGTSYFTVVFIR